MPKRKNNRALWILLVLVLAVLLYREYRRMPAASEKAAVAEAAPGSPGLPDMAGGHEIVTHTAYTLSYNEGHEQADWVAYALSAADLSGNGEERTDNFRLDPSVSTGSATLEDYRRSGYDRGHLAPAADMGRSAEVMSESFFMSNMSPQAPSFNRGMWKSLEEAVRQWVLRDSCLYVVTGPVLEPGLEAIGPNAVSVPRAYYKVLLDLEAPEYKAIGFLMANDRLSGEIWDYAVSVDSVESRTGIDFFPDLPEALETRLESRIDIPLWR